jgi:hypothetical protein
MADGTAQKCGRVGSCHIYLKSLSGNWRAFLCAGIFEVDYFFRLTSKLNFN